MFLTEVDEPKNYNEAITLDNFSGQITGQLLWQSAMEEELDSLKENYVDSCEIAPRSQAYFQSMDLSDQTEPTVILIVIKHDWLLVASVNRKNWATTKHSVLLYTLTPYDQY